MVGAQILVPARSTPETRGANDTAGQAGTGETSISSLLDSVTVLPATTRAASRRFQDAPAYFAPDGWVISYRDLDQISDEVAVGLTRRGVGVGDVVGLLLPPGPEYLFAYLAAAKLGAVTAGVNHRLTVGERERVLERAAPRLVLTADAATPGDHDAIDVGRAAGLAQVLGALRVSDEAPPERIADPGEPLAIVFTSGTTGIPKGAEYCHHQIEFITRTDVGDRWGGGARTFSGTSFAHLGFMTKLEGNLRRGGTTFITERWTAADALRLVADQQMTSIAGVPAQIALMLRHPDFDAHDLSSVRFVTVGGGPVTPGLADEARARFDAALATRYSCTEAGIGLGTGFDDPLEDAVVSVGRPHAAVHLAILDDGDAPVAPGDVGAICLRSPAVMARYWRDPDATAAAFTPDGFVRTGDLGRVDDQGRLRLVGRSKEMYVRGGYNVYPVEVEAALSTHPSVGAIAIGSRTDPVMGEVGVAVVVSRDPRNPPTLAELREHVSGTLAAYKLPEDLRVVEALPFTAMDKLDRRALGALITDADEPDAGVS
jgi:acyl-CoA synthetase (AMP-forming)/AMP-acid ligase II